MSLLSVNTGISGHVRSANNVTLAPPTYRLYTCHLPKGPRVQQANDTWPILFMTRVIAWLVHLSNHLWVNKFAIGPRVSSALVHVSFWRGHVTVSVVPRAILSLVLILFSHSTTCRYPDWTRVILALTHVPLLVCPRVIVPLVLVICHYWATCYRPIGPRGFCSAHVSLSFGPRVSLLLLPIRFWIDRVSFPDWSTCHFAMDTCLFPIGPHGTLNMDT
jgi:hypothetical protein